MPTTTPTMLDQINVEKTKVSERLARLDADRAKIATQLTDLETAERVLTRVSKTPPARRSTSKPPWKQGPPPPPEAAGGRQRQPRTSQRNANPGGPSLGERVLALATGKTRLELYAVCPSDRPNHVGMAVQRHIRARRIQERDGKLYATPTAREQAPATA